MRLETMELMVVTKLPGNGTAFGVNDDQENIFINGRLAKEFEVGDTCEAVVVPNRIDHADRTPWQAVKLSLKVDVPETLPLVVEEPSLRQRVFELLEENPYTHFKAREIATELEIEHGRHAVLRECEALFAAGNISKSECYAAGHFKKPTYNLYAFKVEAFNDEYPEEDLFAD